MGSEECAICGDRVPFGSTTHVLLNPKHVDGVADHYVCRPCYDEHFEGLFAAMASEGTDRTDPDPGGERADEDPPPIEE